MATGVRILWKSRDESAAGTKTNLYRRDAEVAEKFVGNSWILQVRSAMK